MLSKPFSFSNRVVDIMRASAAVDRAQRAVDQIANERTHADAVIASLAGEVTQLDSQAAELARSTCRRRRPPRIGRAPGEGQRVSCSADAAVVAAYREAVRAYEARLTSLTPQPAELRSRPELTPRGSKQASAASPEASDAPSGGEAGARRKGRPVAGLALTARRVRRIHFRRNAGAVRTGQGVRDCYAGDRIRNPVDGGFNRRACKAAQP